ncbi:MAG: hypothetical protein ABIK23_03100 [candidate division WOR-3 bacterium]
MMLKLDIAKSYEFGYNLVVKAVQFSVVAFPKLEREVDFLRLRERFAPQAAQLEPHIQMVQPWVPAELGEVMAVIEFISQARRALHPLAIAAENWQESGEFLIGEITKGQDELISLRKNILGAEPASLLIPELGGAPHLTLFRITGKNERAQAIVEANRIGRTLGVVDALILIRTLPDGMWQMVAKFPFGIARVDFYERLVT